MAGRTQNPPSMLRPWDRPEINFTTLCEMNSGDICQFIAKCAEDSANSKDKNLQSYSKDLNKASDAIKNLVSQKGHKYFVDSSNNLAPKDFEFEGEPISCFSLYDVLGWFMSVIGPAPKGTTKENYLVPMANLFCRWSITLAAGTEVPNMNSVVYVPSTNQSLISCDCFLGFTLPRARLREVGTKKSLKTESQEQRFDMLKKWFAWPHDQAPRAPGNQNLGQCFGHCAETLTFIMAMILLKKDEKSSPRSIDPQKMTGIAMSTTDVLKSRTALESLRDPCPNCQYLIKNLPGADLKKFLVSPSGVKEYEGPGENATGGGGASQTPAAPPPTKPPATSKPSPTQVANVPPATSTLSYAQAARGGKPSATSNPAQVASQPPAPVSTNGVFMDAFGHVLAGVSDLSTRSNNGSGTGPPT